MKTHLQDNSISRQFLHKNLTAIFLVCNQRLLKFQKAASEVKNLLASIKMNGSFQKSVLCLRHNLSR